MKRLIVAFVFGLLLLPLPLTHAQDPLTLGQTITGTAQNREALRIPLELDGSSPFITISATSDAPAQARLRQSGQPSLAQMIDHRSEGTTTTYVYWVPLRSYDLQVTVQGAYTISLLAGDGLAEGRAHLSAETPVTGENATEEGSAFWLDTAPHQPITLALDTDNYPFLSVWNPDGTPISPLAFDYSTGQRALFSLSGPALVSIGNVMRFELSLIEGTDIDQYLGSLVDQADFETDGYHQVAFRLDGVSAGQTLEVAVTYTSVNNLGDFGVFVIDDNGTMAYGDEIVATASSWNGSFNLGEADTFYLSLLTFPGSYSVQVMVSGASDAARERVPNDPTVAAQPLLDTANGSLGPRAVAAYDIAITESIKALGLQVLAAEGTPVLALYDADRNLLEPSMSIMGNDRVLADYVGLPVGNYRLELMSLSGGYMLKRVDTGLLTSTTPQLTSGETVRGSSEVTGRVTIEAPFGAALSVRYGSLSGQPLQINVLPNSPTDASVYLTDETRPNYVESVYLIGTAGVYTVHFIGDNSAYEATLMLDNGFVACQVRAAGNINWRRGPGTTYEIAGQLPQGSYTYVFGQILADDGFIWYQLGDGGFLRSDLPTVVGGDCSQAPTVTYP